MRRLSLFAVSLLFCTGTALPQQAIEQGAPTVQQVIDRIEADFGTSFPPDTVDTYKAGTGDTRVTGIVTTFLPTMEVLRAAVAGGKNLILTHEPPFITTATAPTFFSRSGVHGEAGLHPRSWPDGVSSPRYHPPGQA